MAKQRANFSVDEEILNEFNKLAEENALNKSKWIEKQMYLFIQKNKED